MFCCDFPQWLSISVWLRSLFWPNPSSLNVPAPTTSLNTLLSPFLALPHPRLLFSVVPWSFRCAFTVCNVLLYVLSPTCVPIRPWSPWEHHRSAHLPPRCVRAGWMSNKLRNQYALTVKLEWAFGSKMRALVIAGIYANASGEGNATPLQYSCLENPMDGGAWWATVHGAAKSRTRLTRLSSSSMQMLQYMREVDTVEHSLPYFIDQKSEAYRSPREYQRIQKRHWWTSSFLYLMLVKSLQIDYFRALIGLAVLCEALEGTRKKLVMLWS